MIPSFVLIAAALAASADIIPEPTTVNDQVLGTPEDFATAGPAHICFAELAIDLDPGERAYLVYSGIHWGTVRIVSGKKYADISVGNNWSEPHRQTFVASRGNIRITASDDREKEGEYLFFSHTEWSDGKWALSARIAGPLLRFDRSDDRFLDRITFRADDEPCDIVYAYGWSVMFGDEAPVHKGPDDE